MDKKLELWTITVVSKGHKIINNDDMYMIEYDTIEEVKEHLISLKENGQEMNYVTVFPPNTGFLGTNFMLKPKRNFKTQAIDLIKDFFEWEGATYSDNDFLDISNVQLDCFVNNGKEILISTDIRNHTITKKTKMNENKKVIEVEGFETSKEYLKFIKSMDYEKLYGFLNIEFE